MAERLGRTLTGPPTPLPFGSGDGMCLGNCGSDSLQGTKKQISKLERGAQINWQSARKKDLSACVCIKWHVSHKKRLQKYFIVHVASQQTVHYECISGSVEGHVPGWKLFPQWGAFRWSFCANWGSLKLNKSIELCKLPQNPDMGPSSITRCKAEQASIIGYVIMPHLET